MKRERERGRSDRWNEFPAASRRFPDNRSHLCQVVEPEGFPPRLGDEVTIRYFLLLGQQRGSAVEHELIVRTREEWKRRAERASQPRKGEGRRVEGERTRERE